MKKKIQIDTELPWHEIRKLKNLLKRLKFPFYLRFYCITFAISMKIF